MTGGPARWAAVHFDKTMRSDDKDDCVQGRQVNADERH
jgi:hypothetical protein